MSFEIENFKDPENVEEMQAQMRRLRDFLKDKSDDDLRGLVSHLMSTMGGLTLVLAMALRVLQERGEEMDAPSPAYKYTLQKLADGALLPQAVQRFYMRKQMMKAVARMPLAVQFEIVRDKPIDLVRFVNGEKGVYETTPSVLNDTDVPQVFGPNGIRTEGQQVQWLLGKRKPAIEPPAQRLPYEIKKKRLRIGTLIFTIPEVERMLENMRRS